MSIRVDRFAATEKAGFLGLDRWHPAGLQDDLEASWQRSIQSFVPSVFSVTTANLHFLFQQGKDHFHLRIYPFWDTDSFAYLPVPPLFLMVFAICDQEAPSPSPKKHWSYQILDTEVLEMNRAFDIQHLSQLVSPMSL